MSSTLYTRIIARKLQASQAAVQFILLAGFEPKLVQATALYYETLNPSRTLTQASIDAVSTKLCGYSSATEAVDVTKDDVQKKLNKVFEQNAYNFI